MANYTISISKHVFGNLVRLGSKQLLENPVFPALVCGIFSRLSYEYWKTSFSEQQCSTLTTRRLYCEAHLASKKQIPPSNYGWKLGFSGLAPPLQYSSTLGYMGRSKQTQINGLLAHHVLGRRQYNVDRYCDNRTPINNHHERLLVDDVVKETRAGTPKTKRSHRCLVSALAAASCLGGVAYLISDLDTIPYSKRTRFTLSRRLVVSKARTRKKWEAFKEENKNNILATYHPQSIRVRSITNKLITALERGLQDEKVWVAQGGWKGTLSKALVRESCRLIRECIVDWEVIVVEDPSINAACHLGGKIVVFTGLLKHFQSVDEIASVIAHEVGHAVARHRDEKLAMVELLKIPRLLVHNDVLGLWKHPLVLSMSRRQDVLLLDNEIVFNEAIIEERDEGIKEIQQQIGEVNEIFKDLAVLVHDQGAMIDDISTHVDNSHAATVQGRSHLAKASKIQRSNSSLTCLLLVIFGIVLLIVIIVLAA